MNVSFNGAYIIGKVPCEKYGLPKDEDCKKLTSEVIKIRDSLEASGKATATHIFLNKDQENQVLESILLTDEDAKPFLELNKSMVSIIKQYINPGCGLILKESDERKEGLTDLQREIGSYLSNTLYKLQDLAVFVAKNRGDKLPE